MFIISEYSWVYAVAVIGADSSALAQAYLLGQSGLDGRVAETAPQMWVQCSDRLGTKAAVSGSAAIAFTRVTQIQACQFCSWPDVLGGYTDKVCGPPVP
jgi:hypothetical protein